MEARSRVLAVREGFVLPPELLARSASPPVAARAIEAVFDTSDFRLTRRGIVAYQRRARDESSRWCLRVPLEPPEPSSTGDAIERVWPAESPAPPDALAAAVRSITANGPLVEIARLRRERRTLPLPRQLGCAGALRLHHDYVALLDGRRVVARAWQLQIDGAPGANANAIDALEARLRAAGAHDLLAPSPIASLLGGEALAPPPPAQPTIDRQSTCVAAVASALSHDTHDLAHHLPLLHVVDDVEVVHQARVAVRRFRSNLRTFGPVLDEARSRSLSPGLGMLGDALGAVRDMDVLAVSLDRLRARLPERDHDAATRLIAFVTAERPSARDRLLELTSGDAAVACVDTMAHFAANPPIVARADEPARAVLTQLARRSWRKAVRAAGELDEHSPVDQLHHFRILVKRARYAATAAALVRPEAAAHVTALSRLQTTLGEINDATITEERLRAAVASGVDGETAYAAGVMVAATRRRVQRQRARWPTRWEEARRKKVRTWLDSSE